MRYPGSLSQLATVTIVCAFLLAYGYGIVNAEKGSLKSIGIAIQNDGIDIQTMVENAFNPELLAALNAGIPVEFYYHIQLIRKRWYWFNREISKVKVLHSVSFDTLNKQYKFSNDNGSTSTTMITESLEECKEWMTNLSFLLPFRDEIDYGKGHYYVKVKAESKCSAPGAFRKIENSSPKFSFYEEGP